VYQMRAATLTGYFEVARFVELDPFEMLAEVGLPTSLLSDPEQRHAANSIARLLELSAERSGCESFGLLLAKCRSFAELGPLSLLLERLPTVRDVVKALASYRRHLNDIINIVLEEDEISIIKVEILPEYAGPQILDFTVARLYRNLVGACGGRWTPLALHLVRREPSEDLEFRRFFPFDRMFSDSFNGFSCSAESLDIPNPLANEPMARHASRLLDLVQFGPEEAPTGDRVRRAIVLLLPSGRGSLDHVALNLGFSPRALQRALEREGHSFGEVLNEIRRDLAQQYLANSNHPISTISDLTGYTNSTSFTRWFAGEFGLAPQFWRAAQLRVTAHGASDARLH
jgi:AraC-like DNA-binding protein